MQETRVQSLVQEDPLEKGMAMHTSILAWRIPWTEEPGRLQFMGSQRVGHDWATNTFFTFDFSSGFLFFFFYLSFSVSWKSYAEVKVWGIFATCSVRLWTWSFVSDGFPGGLVVKSVQETRVHSLGGEDPTCPGIAKSVLHKYWGSALEIRGRNYWAFAATAEVQML